MTEARNLNHADAVAGGGQTFGPIELGTVGWEGDTGKHFDLDKSPSDGTTLVKVQLRRGRDHSDPLDPAQSQGNQIWARLSGGAGWKVPEKGTEVLVAFPAGFETVPGAPVIFSVTGASPSIQFGETRAVLDFGDQGVIIRGKSVTLQTNSGDFISITDDGGIKLMTKAGDSIVLESGKLEAFVVSGGNAASRILLDGSSTELQQRNGGSVVVDSVGVTLNGANFVSATGTVALGAYASPATPAVGGLTGMSGVGSTSVWIQP